MTVDINSADFQLPVTVGSSMYEPITLNTVTDITTGPSGTGVFDKLMVSMKAHLQTEYDANRITGAEYTKAYIALTQSALQTALQFVLQNDSSFWEAQNAQIAAITGRIQMETSRETYAAALFNVTTMLPKQSSMLDKQIAGEDLKNQELTYNLATTLPLQTTMLGYQNAGAALANQISTYNLDTTLPLQTAGLTLQNAGETIKNSTASYNLATILPLQSAGLTLQNAGETLKNSTAQYNLDTMLPLQSALLTLQNTGEGTKNQIASYNLATMLPLQSALLTTQNFGESIKNSTATYNLDTLLPLQSAGEDLKNQTTQYNLSSILPLQVTLMGLQNTGEGLKNTGQTTQNSILSYQVGTMMPMQLKLTQEQMEAQRAQTSDLRSDGTTAIVGLIAGQKALYAQQVTSYKRDAEVKAAKLFTDAWITQKTIDDGVVPPPNFTNTSLDAILGTLKTNNAIG